MDETLNTNKKRLLKSITSVVVIMVGFLFSVSQTYALETNENFPTTSDLNYQHVIKLSDLVSKVFNFFSDQASPQNNSNNTTINTNNTSCEQNITLPFTDIQDNQYKDYITTLYSNGIVVGAGEKFLPNNDLRFYCMIKIIVDSYRLKVGYDLKTQLGLSQKNNFSNAGDYIDKVFLKYLNTAYELGFLEGIYGFDVSSKGYFQKNISSHNIKQVFENINKQFPLLVNGSVLNQIVDSANFMIRGEYTKYVVNFFDLDPKLKSSLCSQDWKSNFSDTMDNDYRSDIEILAKLGIVDSQAYKFYPDNYLRNYEFIIMLTKTILKKENQELNIYLLDHTSNISDINTDSTYAKYFEFAYHNGFLDYGFDSQTGNPSVHPNKFVPIQKINRILSKLVGKEVNFKTKSNDGLVTRGEFADILIDGFDLDTSFNNDTTNIINNSESKISLLQEISGRLQSAKLIAKL